MPPDITDNLTLSSNDNGSDEMLIQALSDNEAVMLSLEDELRDLNVAEENLKEIGMVSKEAIANIAKLCPRFSLPTQAPIQSFTVLPSRTNFKVTLEAVEEAKKNNITKALGMLVDALCTMKAVREEFFAVRLPSTDTIGRERTNKRIELMNQIGAALDATMSTAPGENKEHPLTTGARIRYNDAINELLKTQGNAFVMGYISRNPEVNSFQIMEALRTDLVVGAVSLRSRLDMLRNALETLPVLWSDRFLPMVMEPVQYRTVRQLTKNNWKGIGDPAANYTFVQSTLVSYDKTVIDDANGVAENKFGTNQDIVDMVCKMDYTFDSSLDSRLDQIGSDARELMEAIGGRVRSEWKAQGFDEPSNREEDYKLGELLVENMRLRVEGKEEDVFRGIYVLFNEIMVYCQLRQMYQIGMTKVYRFCDRLIEHYYAPMYDRQWLAAAVASAPAVKTLVEKAREDGFFYD